MALLGQQFRARAKWGYQFVFTEGGGGWHEVCLPAGYATNCCAGMWQGGGGGGTVGDASERGQGALLGTADEKMRE